KPWQPTITGGVEPERLVGQRVSAAYFRVLGVSPALGRGFEASEDRAAGPRGAVFSDPLWPRRLGGHAAVPGRPALRDGDACTVIGILPRGFETVLEPGAELFTTPQYDMVQDRAWGHHLHMVGRVAGGSRAEDAAGELQTIAKSKLAEFPRRP